MFFDKVVEFQPLGCCLQDFPKHDLKMIFSWIGTFYSTIPPKQERFTGYQFPESE